MWCQSAVIQSLRGFAFEKGAVPRPPYVLRFLVAEMQSERSFGHLKPDLNAICSVCNHRDGKTMQLHTAVLLQIRVNEQNFLPVWIVM